MIYDHRNGCVIVFFALHFKIPVTVDEGISELRSAVERGTIGPYAVSSLQILEVDPGITPPVSPTVVSTTSTTSVTTEEKATTTPAPSSECAVFTFLDIQRWFTCFVTKLLLTSVNFS